MQEDIASLERLLATIKDQTRQNAAMRIDAIKADLASLDTSIKDWDGKVMEASTKDAEYQRLKDAATRTNSLYEKLVTSVRELDLGKGIDQTNVQIMQTRNHAGTSQPWRAEAYGDWIARGFVTRRRCSRQSLIALTIALIHPPK